MSAQVVKDYRFILKHIKALPSTQNWKGPVQSQFLQGRKETNQERIKHLRALASQYATMVRSINELKFLRGLDSGEKLDPRDKIRATAGRVGLSVPKFADEDFPDVTKTPELPDTKSAK